MRTKKAEKAKLENYSKFFFQLGLVLSLLIVYILIESKTYERTLNDLVGTVTENEVIEEIPITERIELIKPPPPPPAAPERIEIVEDQSEVEEAVLESTETDENQIIEVSEINEIEEVVEEEEVAEDVPFAIIEEAPVYPGCKGTKAQKKKCLQEKIKEHVNKKYNTGLAGDLGLEAGNKKVYVQFKIDKTGNITNIRARGPHKRLEKEAIRVVKLLPKMTPGRQRGRSVGVKYTLPITLKVL